MSTQVRKESDAVKKRMTLDQKILDDIVHRIVEVAHPDKIILFGSAARGERGHIAMSTC